MDAKLRFGLSPAGSNPAILPLYYFAMVAPLGFEPRLADSESTVLPIRLLGNGGRDWDRTSTPIRVPVFRTGEMPITLYPSTILA